jgi:hypothetical protein
MQSNKSRRARAKQRFAAKVFAANSSDEPRRSIQCAYIWREAQSGVNLPEQMRPETLARISPLAKYVLAV